MLLILMKNIFGFISNNKNPRVLPIIQNNWNFLIYLVIKRPKNTNKRVKEFFLQFFNFINI